jgi:hypothetical protein
MSLTLKSQEISFDAPESCRRFIPSAEKPFVASILAGAVKAPLTA